jgi:hypothetical protein
MGQVITDSVGGDDGARWGQGHLSATQIALAAYLAGGAPAKTQLLRAAAAALRLPVESPNVHDLVADVVGDTWEAVVAWDPGMPMFAHLVGEIRRRSARALRVQQRMVPLDSVEDQLVASESDAEREVMEAQMARLERVLPVLRERVRVRDPIGTWVLKFAEDGHYSHAAAVKHGMTVTKLEYRNAWRRLRWHAQAIEAEQTTAAITHAADNTAPEGVDRQHSDQGVATVAVPQYSAVSARRAGPRAQDDL